MAGRVFTIPVAIAPQTGTLVPDAAGADDRFVAGYNAPLPVACRVHGRWEAVGVVSTCHFDVNVALLRMRLLGHILLAAGAATCNGYQQWVRRFDDAFAARIASIQIAEIAYAAPRALIEAAGTIRPFDATVRQLAFAQFPQHIAGDADRGVRPSITQERHRVSDDTLILHGVPMLPFLASDLPRKGRGVWLWCARHRRWQCVATAPLMGWKWSALLRIVGEVALATRAESCDEYQLRAGRFREAWSAAHKDTLLSWLAFRNWARTLHAGQTATPELAREALAPR